MKKIVKLVCVTVVTTALSSGCTSVFNKHVEWETIEPEQYPVLKAIGYAPIHPQQGETPSQREIMALKASKLDAYRELTEQVYGQRINGEQTVANMVMTDSQLQSTVEGVIRGARVVKAYPAGEDTYVTELELDMQRVFDLYLSTAKPKRVRKVTYY
ncbi:LPP20 family lipoprotein [Alteromonas lipotrueiana]|uniref:LPP20 family lipoprotein n=1 Tax=Alteromonas lipotrueiana TaxID=2803815 RepID=UPI001C44DAA7|nr:LPP20 family lipoprotein [Alteromonas lipotrueiana]